MCVSCVEGIHYSITEGSAVLNAKIYLCICVIYVIFIYVFFGNTLKGVLVTRYIYLLL